MSQTKPWACAPGHVRIFPNLPSFSSVSLQRLSFEASIFAPPLKVFKKTKTKKNPKLCFDASFRFSRQNFPFPHTIPQKRCLYWYFTPPTYTSYPPSIHPKRNATICYTKAAAFTKPVFHMKKAMGIPAANLGHRGHPPSHHGRGFLVARPAFFWGGKPMLTQPFRTMKV